MSSKPTDTTETDRIPLTIEDVADSEERFYDKVTKGSEYSCWPFGNAANRRYGLFYVNEYDQMIQAHRVAYVLEHGEIPDGTEVAHKCDTKACVNPNHLEAISHQQNMADAITRDQIETARGSDHGKAKLDEDDVRDIKRRLDDESYQELADEYGVSKSTISCIANEYYWTHVDV